ncbi:AraC family transcriptional regulator [Nocardia stercoris]|uniref:HTH-type transcriptional regulator RipA n=2 Tax=Nocardia stercoris TaxID=2483361 RepID=A0A3M2L1A6_9NOCA|nr:AraC family transcriptional regulator [Nocardia stercoris]
MVFGAGVLPPGYWFDEHRHPQHQITWAARGVVAVDSGAGHWVLPPTRALWIPGGIAHRTGSAAGADLRGIFLEPARCPAAFARLTLLRVTPLLRELFDHMTSEPLPDDHRRRAEAVVFDLLEPVDVVPLGAPLPTDPRARAVAEALLANPADARTLAEFATATASSARTLARAFRTDTGSTFAQWRTQIRLAASLPLLADGLPVARIAPRVGYAGPSAYVAAFRRTVGISPGRYFTR